MKIRDIIFEDESLSIAEGAVKDIEQKLKDHAQRKIDQEKKTGQLSGPDLFSHEQYRKQLLKKRQRALSDYRKKFNEDDMSAIEDEADSRGDAVLISVLEWLRTQAEESSAVTPRVKVDTVIDRVRAIPGNEGFNYAALEAAHEHNETVKSLIKDIKDDEKSGSKYIYLALPENTVDDSDPLGARGAEAGDSSKIVSKMAAKAAQKESREYTNKPDMDMEEGVASKLVKGVKRLATGKDLDSRKEQTAGQMFAASLHGDDKSARKHNKNLVRLSKVGTQNNPKDR